MKQILLLERYILSNMLEKEHTKHLDKKLKGLQKFIYSSIYDSKMIHEHLDFIKSVLQECNQNLQKITSNPSNIVIDKNDESLVQEPGKTFVDINPASSERQLEYVAQNAVLKVLNLESKNFDTDDFTNEERFKKKLVILYFLPSSMEKYLLESSKKQSKREKLENLKKILNHIIW